MVDRDVIAAKLAELALRVERVRAHAELGAAELSDDADAVDLVSFNLMVAVQVCADMASHITAGAGWPVARTLGESFARLAEHGVVTANTAAAMTRAVAFQDVVAHGYATVDVAAVHRASTAGLEDIDRFAREVAAWSGSP